MLIKEFYVILLASVTCQDPVFFEKSENTTQGDFYHKIERKIYDDVIVPAGNKENISSEIQCAMLCSREEFCHFFSFDSRNCILKRKSVLDVFEPEMQFRYFPMDKISEKNLMIYNGSVELTNGGVLDDGIWSKALFLDSGEFVNITKENIDLNGDFSENSPGFTVMFWLKLLDCDYGRDVYTSTDNNCAHKGLYVSSYACQMFLVLCTEFGKQIILINTYIIPSNEWVHVVVFWSPLIHLNICFNTSDCAQAAGKDNYPIITEDSGYHTIGAMAGTKQNINYMKTPMLIDEMMFFLEALSKEIIGKVFRFYTN